MAYDKDQNEPSLPAGSNPKRESSNLLPRFYRTNSNKKFLQATLDQLVQPGTVKKINGYIGREYSKANNVADIFLSTPDKIRQDYQLEPAAVIKDYLGNTTFFKDYIDHVNQVSVLDGNTDNHSRLNHQEFYSWNPHIDWDKFVNFQQYYWLPFGPEPITVPGQQQEIISTYSVTVVDEVDNFAYLFNPEGPLEGLVRNPTLTLFRGQTYIFDITATNHPFSLKTERSGGTIDRYNQGVTGNGTEVGQIIFEVPLNSPDVIYYVSENSVDTGGVIQILDIEENTFIDIAADILGKKSYSIPDTVIGPVSLSNGMKLNFIGKVSPEIYSEGYWYVDGVGSNIKLISEKDIEVRSSYVEDSVLLFDDIPFDQVPFSEVGSFPSKKDYVTINRGSIDNNPWSRYNRWFHSDVIRLSAEVNKSQPNFDQLARAIRPIIEFNAGLKLYNFGTVAKKSVDLIDNFTKDVFSTIEGTLGYNVDGIDLADGMRIIFNADTDILVKNKTYKVNFINVVVPGRKINFSPETTIRLENSTINFSTEHGLATGNQIYYQDNEFDAIPGLTNRTVYWVQVVNQLTIALYKDPKLTKQVEILGTALGTHTLEVYSGKRRQIQLTEEIDTIPEVGETAAIKFGKNEQLANNLIGNQGHTYWFNGTNWVLGQVKTSVNQAPLFDLFDNTGTSFSEYEGSNFRGNRLFGYKVSTNGTVDSELGFGLTYQNINNVGDIVFEFYLLNENFAYKINEEIKYKNSDTGFLKVSSDLSRFKFENGWTTTSIKDYQPVIKTIKGQTGTKFDIDVFDDKNNLDDLKVRIYLNGKKLNSDKFSIGTGSINKFVELTTSISENDILVLKCFAKQVKNINGHYELPINLQNNPLNNNLSTFTLGQVVDHVGSIVDNIENFSGIYPGVSNLKDLGQVSSYGTKFVQHSGSLNLPLYFLGTKDANIIKALDKARDDYNKYKRSFILAATESSFDGTVREHVNYILEKINKDKPKTNSYFLSDMVAYSGFNKLVYTVLDSRIKTYPLSILFNLKSLSNKAVNIYVNGDQLVEGRDYAFGDTEFFEIYTELNENDVIEAYEYDTTDGCFCPPTPTKLGMFPKYEPQIYLDDTYSEPTVVIQGHDGSIIVAYNDYRDELLLEFEKRIFNNIKTQYNSEIFDIYDYIPGYGRETDYSKSEFNNVLAPSFFKWVQLVGLDFTKSIGFDPDNRFTYNYSGMYTPDNQPSPLAWRGIYTDLFDTIRPHICPWESLGFSIKPKWWEEQYGPAPYTSDNLVLWDDIRQGIVREPNKPPRKHRKFERTILENRFPVTTNGKLAEPAEAGFVTGIQSNITATGFTFGDIAPVEAAWRKSSYYPFDLLKTLILLKPADILGKCLDRSRIVRDLTGQLVYADTGLRLQLSSVKSPSVSQEPNTERVYTSGLINYILDLIVSKNLTKVSNFKQDLIYLTNELSSRLGAFTSKQKYRILLDSKNPSATGGVFVPEENYSVNLNVSGAVKKVVYSGVIITKVEDGFEIKGYNYNNQYFTTYPYQLTDKEITVGGISESYILWSPDQYYVAGKVLRNGNTYYRVRVSHTSREEFDENLYIKLPGLPLVGGKSVLLRKGWDYSNPKRIAYSTILSSIQDVSDFLQGYGAFLEQEGFVFDTFNTNLSSIANWTTSIKEFLIWTTQNWTEGSTISLSPSAGKLEFKSTNSVIDNIVDPFYEYNIFKLDGKKLEPELINVYRSEGQFVLEPANTSVGIFGAVLYLVQKEHVVVFDNTTMFNDTIYNKETGYRQDRLKVLGYVTNNWNGSFEAPGFIYDQVNISDWTPWTDYNLGDIVKYKEFFYSARQFLPGVETFNYEHWFLLENKLESKLLPNWDYKAEQFTDFYDLDTDNFDIEQQRVAQHLIGYQKRQYLENIINNDVSQYKFYQGMIVEKGTQNVFNKLFDVLSDANQESLTFDEEWAFRVGEYGAVDSFDEIEFVLDEKEFRINPQPLELVTAIDPKIIDFVYRQIESDVYIKPKNFTTNLWPTLKAANFLRTPGHIRKEDILLSVDTLDSLLTIPNFKYTEGQYIQTAFEGTSWNVYRITRNKFKIVNLEHSTNSSVLECDSIPNLIAGDIIRIESSPTISAFVKVLNVQSNKLTTTLIPEKAKLSTITISFYLKSVRFNNIDNVNDTLDYKIKVNETVWVDDSGNGLWSIFKNNPIYNKTTLINTNPSTNLVFGKELSITGNGNTCAVSSEVSANISDRGKAVVTIFEKDNSNTVWRSTNKFYRKTDSNFDSFGDVTKFSKDGEWFVISAPDAGFFYLYKRNTSRKFTKVKEFESTSGYGANFEFIKIATGYFLVVYNSNTSTIEIYKHTTDESDSTWNTYGPTLNGNVIERYGYALAGATNTQGEAILAVTVPGNPNVVFDNAGGITYDPSSYIGKIVVYRDTGSAFVSVQEINYNPSNNDFENFGSSIAISDDANHIAIGANLVNVTGRNDAGVVLVYKMTDNSYTLLQTIYSQENEVNEQFGSKLGFMNNDQTLAIFSANKDSARALTFDKNSTTFDKDSCSFGDVVVDAAMINIYDRYNDKFLYGESLLNQGTKFDKYGYAFAVGSNTVITSAINRLDKALVKSGKVLSYVKPSTKTSWLKTTEQSLNVDVSKIKKAFLYNRRTNELITYLDVVDSQQGKLPGIADQEIKFKTYYDPAVYTVGTSTVNIDEGLNWTKEHVGMLWWDLTRAKFNDNNSGNTLFKSSNWNKLYDTASIDIYEWVETKVLPAEWTRLADTAEGIARGISGTPKYGNTVYSVSSFYDTLSQTVKNTYYYWVKNKKDIPNVEGRSVSAFNVAQLIADPVAYGYPCLVFHNKNSISLVNIEKYLEDSNVVLNVQYWLSDNRTNYHSQWKLLSLNKNTVIPSAIESKWFHSLIGKDDAGRLVPDIKLPTKNRYGIEFRPRQGMFINRTEALKQLIERTNSTLKNILIADTFDLSKLLQADLSPTEISGLWDFKIDIEEELRFVPTKNFVKPQLTPIIDNGKIIDVIINSSGSGYVTYRPYEYSIETLDPISWYGPTVVVQGAGTGALIKTIINSSGQIIGTIIDATGQGYNDTTTLIVRSLSTLVVSDTTALESWALYEWNIDTAEWIRINSQAYNVTKYWKFIDWYAAEYNQFTKIDRIFENTHQLVVTDVPLNSVVKINNVGSGGWMLLRKYNDAKTIDYTENYQVIARQNGTVEFLSTIYNSSTSYDTLLLDSTVYDNYPVTELRIILESLRDNIFVDQYRVDYLKLFFASVRYVMHEQLLVDWAFKTSFVKSQHNVGQLQQKVTYKNDNLENFEEYIKEVKPYRTKIREFVTSYGAVDPTKTVISDFDLLPLIGEDYSVSPMSVSIVDNQVSANSPEINLDPWKNWLDNVGFKITSIEIVDQGTGYASNPLVEIVGDQLPGGTPAIAKAYIANRKVNRIDILDPGSKWINTPRVILKGGLGAGGSDARAVAIIGDSVIRSSMTKIKFDRISKVYQITNLEATETFSGNIVSGSRTQFPLIWSPNIETNSYMVVVNGAEALRSDYKVTTVSKFNGKFTEYSGLLTFTQAPSKGSIITIEYHKNFNHLAANDRINFYYNPVAGQVGKDLSQLMTGIDYGGVNITGVGFEENIRWDNLPQWNETTPGLDDYVVDISQEDQYTFKFPYVPEIGQVINVYVARFNIDTLKHDLPVRVDDINYLTINQTNSNAVMRSFVGTGNIDIIELPEILNLNIYTISNNQYSDRIIFRKIESDGSTNPKEDDYDTKLTGGSFAYNSATGFAPDDIILDGDGLVTAMTSNAPEEVVPGQIMDAVAIKVYTRPGGGCPNIMFKNYISDGETTTYTIGQYFPSSNSIIVKIENEILTFGVDYLIDYQTNVIVLDNNAIPNAGSEIAIISISFNSANILDLDFFTADGTTSEYVTRAPWLPNINATVLLNGNVTPFEVFSTDDNYTASIGQSWRSRTAIRFPVAPPAGAIINYIIDTSDVVQSASIIKSQTITYSEGIDTYDLTNQIGVDYPLEANVLVKTGNTILSSPSYSYFNIEDGKRIYSLLDSKYQNAEVNVGNLLAYVDGKELRLGIDYSVNLNYAIPLHGVDINNFVLEGGTGYQVGDIITITGGTPYTNTAAFLVDSVLAGGVIQRVDLIDPGLYIEVPTAPFVLQGGSGTGAGLVAEFTLQQDLPNIEIEIASRFANNGALLVVGVSSFADYSIDNDTITFNSSYPNNTEIEIISFYNHNNLGIERTVDTFNLNPVLDSVSPEYFEYNAKLGGVFKLTSPVVSGDFVWVIKNGNLLVNRADYELKEDFQTLILNDYLTTEDKVQIIAFTNTVVTDQFGYMQFKDMLNRTHYKRLNKDKSTVLLQGLGQFDNAIVVLDIDKLDNPIPQENKPGIIEIDGERIEYFVKDGNMLKQLRRGTLGTGIPTMHISGTVVQNLGPSETIPYKDEIIVDSIVADGVNNEIELSYSLNSEQLESYQTYSDFIEVFVGGIRLKKDSYMLYTNTDYPNSPAGDTTLDPEFTYATGKIILTNTPQQGVIVTVIKKQGAVWTDTNKRLANSNNKVAKFVKEVESVWPVPIFRN
jgi:hypothetical protein